MTDTTKLYGFYTHDNGKTTLDYDSRHIYDDYVYSVIECGNKTLCLHTCFSDEDISSFINALDEWGVDEFVYTATDSHIFSHISALCDAGWSIAGVCDVNDGNDTIKGMKLVKVG